MPVIPDRNEWAAWLDTGAVAPERLLALLGSFPEDTMQAWGVSHAVNRVNNGESKLLQPIARGRNKTRESTAFATARQPGRFKKKLGNKQCQ